MPAVQLTVEDYTQVQEFVKAWCAGDAALFESDFQHNQVKFHDGRVIFDGKDLSAIKGTALPVWLSFKMDGNRYVFNGSMDYVGPWLTT